MPDVNLEVQSFLSFDLRARLGKTPEGVTETPLQIMIDRVNYTGLYRPATLNMRNRLNGRQTASFQLVDRYLEVPRVQLLDLFDDAADYLTPATAPEYQHPDEWYTQNRVSADVWDSNITNPSELTIQITGAQNWQNFLKDGPFFYRKSIRDFDLVVDLAAWDFQGGASTTRAGLLVQSDVNADNWCLIGAHDNAWEIIAEETISGVTSIVGQTGGIPTANRWFRLRRRGADFFFDYGTDGATWVNLAQTQTPIGETARVGIVLSQQSGSAINIARFGSYDLREVAPFRPEIGDPVRITWDEEDIFVGSVDSYDETDPLHPENNFLNIRLTDVNGLCDRFLVANTYEVEGQTLRDIVRDLVEVASDGLLAAEGVTARDFVEKGPQIGRAVFNYKTHAQCFNELSEITGFVWFVDTKKRLHFIDPFSNPSSVSFTEDLGNYRQFSINRTRKKYRNRQFFRGGTGRTQLQIDERIGDGSNSAFTLDWPVDNVGSWDGTGQRPEGPDAAPLVDLNSVPQSVGVKGAEDEEQYQFLYQRGADVVTYQRQEGQPDLEPTDNIEFRYYGQFPVLVEVPDEVEIVRRAEDEGGTGEYHAIDVDEDVDTIILALDRADGLLRRFGFIPTIVTIRTDTLGVQVGDLVSIRNDQHGINDWMVCTGTSVQDISSGYEYLRFTLTFEMDERTEDWVEFWQRFVTALGPQGISENDRVIVSRIPREELLVTDTFVTDVTPGAPALLSGTLDPYSWNWYGQAIPAIGTPEPGYDTIPGMVHGFSRHGIHPNA